MKSNMKWLCMAVMAGLLGAQAAQADELAVKGRDIMKKNQGALVTVSALSKLDMSGSGLPIQIGGLGEAQESTCTGLVLDDAGLTVVSYSALNPMEKLGNAMKISIGGEGESQPELKPKAEMSRIQIHLPDGQEVPARLVFKDKELDLAFVMPELKEGEKAPAFSPIQIAAGATAKELEDVVVLSRHNKKFGYPMVVGLSRVSAVIAKPRPMYDLMTGHAPGSAVFLPDGKLLGMQLIAGSDEEEASGGMLQMQGGDPIVLPAGEIMKLADEAKKAAAKKSDDK